MSESIQPLVRTASINAQPNYLPTPILRDPAMSFLTTTSLIYAIGAGITAALSPDLPSNNGVMPLLPNIRGR